MPLANWTTFGKCWLVILVVLIITGNFCGGGGGAGKVGSIFSTVDSSSWKGENGKSSKRSMVEAWLDDDDESGDGKFARKFFNSFSNSIKINEPNRYIEGSIFSLLLYLDYQSY